MAATSTTPVRPARPRRLRELPHALASSGPLSDKKLSEAVDVAGVEGTGGRANELLEVRTRFDMPARIDELGANVVERVEVGAIERDSLLPVCDRLITAADPQRDNAETRPRPRRSRVIRGRAAERITRGAQIAALQMDGAQ